MKKPDPMQVARNLWERGTVTANWIEQHRWARVIINLSMILFVLIFVYTYISKDWRTLSNLKIHIRPDSVILSVLTYGINFLLMAQIWHMLVRMIGAKVSWTDDYEMYGYSALSRFLPTPVWYLASRTALYERNYGLSKRSTLLLTFFETFLHFISGVAIYGCLLIRAESPFSWIFLLALLPVLLVVVYPRQIFQFLSNSKDEGSLSVSPVKMIEIFILYLITWVVSIFFFRYTIQITSELQLTNTKMWEIWIIATLVSYLSTYTLGGVGMFREFSLSLLLSPYFTPPVALMISVMVRLMMTLAGVVWSLLLVGFIKVSTGFNALRKRERLQ